MFFPDVWSCNNRYVMKYTYIQSTRCVTMNVLNISCIVILSWGRLYNLMSYGGHSETDE